MFDRIRSPARALAKQALLIPALFLALAGTAPAAADLNDMSAVDAGQQWRFRVYLDDREIGYHSFRVEQVGDYERVEIEASFDIRILFFNAYQEPTPESRKNKGINHISSTPVNISAPILS